MSKSNSRTLLIRNGHVIGPKNNIDKITNVLIENGRILDIDDSINSFGIEEYDASGKIVVPGLIDMHVHFREPGQEYKEDFLSGSKAAASGGFTTVATMPNTLPVIDNAALVRSMIKRAEEIGIVKIKIIGSVTKGQNGKELSEMRDMINAGAIAFSDDGHFINNAKILINALDYLHVTNRIIICHEEESSLVEDGVMNEGRQNALLGLKGRPNIAEDIAVARDVLLSEYTGGRIHIAHVSSARSVEIIRDAKKRGIKVTAEVTPQHLTLTEDLVDLADSSTKINPPLRTQKDCQALLEGLIDGTIDAIVTDHSPHAFEEKDREYIYAPSGFPGLETCVGVLFTELYHKNKIDLKTLISKLTTAPARILGLNSGSLSIGNAADITIIDPEFEWIVNPKHFYTKGSHSPFKGHVLKGKAVKTIINGNVLNF